MRIKLSNIIKDKKLTWIKAHRLCNTSKWLFDFAQEHNKSNILIVQNNFENYQFWFDKNINPNIHFSISEIPKNKNFDIIIVDHFDLLRKELQANILNKSKTTKIIIVGFRNLSQITPDPIIINWYNINSRTNNWFNRIRKKYNGDYETFSSGFLTKL